MPTSSTQPDNLAYLYRLLAALNRRLQAQVEHVRPAMDVSVRDDLLGLFLTDAEVDHLLNALDAEHQAPSPFGRSDAWHGAPPGVNGMSRAIPGAVGAAAGTVPIQAGLPELLAAAPAGSRLRSLARTFRLDPFEQHVILLGLAPEMDGRYERLYGYLHNDIGRKRPSIGLALALFCDDAQDRAATRRAFAPGAPLRSQHLIALGQEDTGRLPPPLPGYSYRLDDRIASYLLGLDDVDPSLYGMVSIELPETSRGASSLSAEQEADVARLAALAGEAGRVVACLWGPDEPLKREAARGVCRRLGLRMIALDAGPLRMAAGGSASERPSARERSSGRERVTRAFREMRLAPGGRAGLYVAGLDGLLADDRELGEEIVHQALAAAGPVFLSTALPWEQLRAGDREAGPVLTLSFPAPDQTGRVAAWHRSLPGLPAVEAEGLAARFRLTGAQIAAAAGEARAYAQLRGDVGGPQPADLARAARGQSNQALARLATKIEATQTWDDLILPRAPSEQLRSIASYVRYRHTVYQTWGFARRMPLGSGVTALFAGPSGTGKTLAAGILAHTLGLDIYRIDLSSVVSKYIGETEKNLSQVFHEAESANAVLFFDEADALFGKRSDVKDAHDRYANIEVAYLLQRMEAFDGLAILATNLREHIDAAFARRLQFAIAFPMPDLAERERIWRCHLPPTAPLADDVDPPFLARIPLSGGNIKNCVLAAAFMAAESGRPIEMQHLVRAVARELEKIGRPVLQSEFGPYYARLH